MSEEELADDVRNRRIGFVFEQFNLLPSLTAGRYVELPLCYADADRKSGLCLHHRRPRLLGQLHAAGRTIVLITQEAAVKAAAARTMQIWTAPSALTAPSACTRRRHTVHEGTTRGAGGVLVDESGGVANQLMLPNASDGEKLVTLREAGSSRRRYVLGCMSRATRKVVA
jgi:hypothetical protein